MGGPNNKVGGFYTAILIGGVIVDQGVPGGLHMADAPAHLGCYRIPGLGIREGQDTWERSPPWRA